MRVFLVNPSHVSFGTAVITPRWLYVLAGATPSRWGEPIVADETLDPFDAAQLAPGDVVGIGIHTGNALRGYEVGQLARARGAYVVFGGIHSTLYPAEAHALGGAHAVVRGDGDVIWATVIDDCAAGTPRPDLRSGKNRWRDVQDSPVGSPAERPVHVGIDPDGARVPEALLVLLGVAHRWPGPEAGGRPCRDPRGGGVTTTRVPIHRAR